jgi:hypothetical protein
MFWNFFAINTYALRTSDITVKIDGTQIQFDQPPIIQRGRTLVPMRAIFEALDCSVTWQQHNMSIISIAKSGKVIFVQIDNTVMTVDGKDTILDVPPQLVNDRTLVPVRAISEALEARVEWNDATQTVNIYTENITTHDDFNEFAKRAEQITNHIRTSSSLNSFNAEETIVINGNSYDFSDLLENVDSKLVLIELTDEYFIIANKDTGFESTFSSKSEKS